MKKSTMKILMAALSLIMALGIATGSTFAWFSLNNKVTVTGMQVTTKVGDSIQIAADTLDSTAKKDEANFKSGINQTVTGLLEPVSTINGKDFYYTSSSNVKATGDAELDSYIAYAEGDAFDKNYGLNDTNSSADALGYVDYVFQIKAMNTDPSDPKNVKLTALNLLYKGAAANAAGTYDDTNITEIKAFRVAVFAKDITSAAPAGNLTAANAISILKPSGAANFTANNAVASTSALGTVLVPDTAATIGAVPANTTSYFKVVVRMWLEGEDNTCNNSTYVNLTGAWNLDLAVELGAGAGVTAIGSAANAVVGVAGATATVTVDGTNAIANGEIVKTFAWKNVATDGTITAAAGTNNEAAYTATADGNFYCEIETVKGSIYKTAVVAIDVP